MARRLKRSSLLLGQTQKPATTPSLAGYYKNVAAGQRGAVQEIGKGVEEKTRGLTGELGLTETVDKDTGKVSTGMADDSKFDVTVAGPTPAKKEGDTETPETPGGISVGGEKVAGSPTLSSAVVPTVPSQTTLKDADGNPLTGQSLVDALTTDQTAFQTALDALGTSITDWQNSGLEAKEFLDKVLADTRKSATEIITEVNQRLGEKNLGQRRAPSEIEKQAQSYQNIIASEPGTSNIKALANLSRFYDMSKYGAVESGIRQGEMAMSRQEMLGEKEAMETAEGARTAAIKDYGEQSKLLTGELETQLTTQEEEERKKLADFFTGEEDKLTTKKGEIETKAGEIKTDLEAAEEEVKKEKEKEFKTIESEIFGGDDPETGELRKGIQNSPENVQGLADTLDGVLRDWKDKGIFTAWDGISKDKGVLENIIDLTKNLKKTTETFLNQMKVAREQRDTAKLKDLYQKLKNAQAEYRRQYNEKRGELTNKGQKIIGAMVKSP